MANTHAVVKPFMAEGESLSPGTLVDASAWRNTKYLVEGRFLRPLTAEEHAAELEQAREQAREEMRADAPPVDATDSARELAEAHGINLLSVQGSGAEGRVIKADVEALLEEGSAA